MFCVTRQGEKTHTHTHIQELLMPPAPSSCRHGGHAGGEGEATPVPGWLVGFVWLIMVHLWTKPRAVHIFLSIPLLLASLA